MREDGKVPAVRRAIAVADLVRLLEPQRCLGVPCGAVQSLAWHPNQVSDSDGVLFVCMDEYHEYNRWGTWRDHLSFLKDHPVAAVILPEFVKGIESMQFVVAQPRRAIGILAAALTGRPHDELRLIGVTGTNGKTTSTHLIAHALDQLGLPCGVIGTLGTRLGSRHFESSGYTTPLAGQTYQSLRDLADVGATFVAMEVSSHGLALDRVEGLDFSTALVTNMGRDHLDFHGTVEAYEAAKLSLMERVQRTGKVVLPIELPRFIEAARRRGLQPVTFSNDCSNADVTVLDWQPGPDGMCGTVRCGKQDFPFTTKLFGEFQLRNWLGAFTVLWANGHEPKAIISALASCQAVCGRMEQIRLPKGCLAIVDYAHNPDGLESLLRACQRMQPRRILLVFGCGGDRDRGKRPLMGAIAARIGDTIYLTSDNPRTEDPQQILGDILAGIDRSCTPTYIEPDRERAIRAACADATEGDLVVVAGKGHEDYQLIGDQRIPFSDQAILRSIS